jgi:protein-tyrosine-phosphatase
MPLPLFVCHANCCRSVLAQYLYPHLCPGHAALGAGVQAGEHINDRAYRMLRGWGVNADSHAPRQLDRALCDQADGIFVMTPPVLHYLLETWGEDLAGKCYLFADPFTRPRSFRHGEYAVYDPSFDKRSVTLLRHEFGWFRERVVQIHRALHGQGHKPLAPATAYRRLLKGL